MKGEGGDGEGREGEGGWQRIVGRGGGGVEVGWENVSSMKLKESNRET